MKKPLIAALLGFLFLCIGLQDQTRAESLSFRTPLPPDQEAVDRLIINSHFNYDHLGVIGKSTDGPPPGSAGTYYLAQTLVDSGFFSRSARILGNFLQKHAPEDPWWGESLIRYIALSRMLPDLRVPVPDGMARKIPDEPALHFAAYLLERGDIERSRNILAARREANPPPTSLSVLTEARLETLSNNLDESVKILRSFRSPETSAATDLVYLIKGYSYLESNEPRKARQAFLAIPPSSPFSPDALYGLAWSFIRTGDLTGAAVRFQELLNIFPFSSSSQQAALELAVTYRELGLYRNAAQVLDDEGRRLTEYSQWLRSLTERDLKSGGDLSILLTSAIIGDPPPEDILERTPAFIRSWIIDAVSNRIISRSTWLLRGTDRMKEETARLARHHRDALDRFQWEIDWSTDESREMSSITNSLRSARRRLPSFREDLFAALEKTSLEDFAPERAIDMIGRVSALRRRLKTTQSDISRVREFSSVIEKIRGSSPATDKERQLNRIRESAYRGLIGTRERLTGIRSELRAFEGRIWLLVKGEAVRHETDAVERIANEGMNLQRLTDKTRKALEQLSLRGEKLSEAKDEAEKRMDHLETAINSRLDDISLRILSLRNRTALDLAGRKADELDDTRAFVIYTAADIEIQRMDEVLRAMQEAVP